MTNNKTPLQKALDDIIGLSGATYYDVGQANEEHAVVLVRHMSTVLNALKAAQAYEDLPSKVKGMQTYKLNEEHPDILIKREDILTLLKETKL
jgi:hypothetical protein